MTSNPTTPSTGKRRETTFKANNRGAFLNSVWHCDCDPRLPADKFQTKNGGKNHGRWFYTCQKPQHKRCNFFLWADDAKVREESAVLSGKRSEPGAGGKEGGAPVTPQKNRTSVEPPTPTSKPRSKPDVSVNSVPSRAPPPPQTPSKVKNNIKPPDPQAEDDEFDWSSSADDDLISTAEAFETPRKTPRTPFITSPGKRAPDSHLPTTPFNPDDVFTTPNTSKPPPNGTGILSPTKSQPPTPSNPPPSTLLSETLSLLSPHPLPPSTISSLTTLLTTHTHAQTTTLKARDVTRNALRTKSQELNSAQQRISQLEARIEGLEGEKETLRSVIQHLKGDMALNAAKSTRKGGRGRGGGQDDDAGSVGGRGVGRSVV
jgi:hypothetical protein